MRARNDAVRAEGGPGDRREPGVGPDGPSRDTAYGCRVTTQSPGTDSSDGELPRPVTGVARGGLGTATNLDDTQVYALDELRDPQAAQPEPELPFESTPEPEPPARVAQPARPTPAPAAPVATAADTMARPGRSRGNPIVGVAAVVAAVALLVVVGSSWLTNRDGGLSVGQTLPTAGASSVLPSESPGDSGGGNGKGNGNGNGNGNGPKK